MLISDDNEIIAGHGRVQAAKQLGFKTVPTIRLSHLSERERRAYILADNKLALNSGWDPDILSTEFQFLIDTEFDLSLTGFSLAETDFILDGKRERSTEPEPSPADAIPEPPAQAVSQHGDLWSLGNHRLLCGDAREEKDIKLLLQSETVDLIFTDPPYMFRSTVMSADWARIVTASSPAPPEKCPAKLYIRWLRHDADCCRDLRTKGPPHRI